MIASMEKDEGEDALPYQEQRAWLGLTTTAVVYGAFLAAMLATPAQSLSLWRFMIAFTIAIAVQSVVLAVGHAVFVARDREAVMAPLDERDLLVARRATMAAYGTLMAIVFLLGVALPYFEAAGWQITLAAIMSMSVAEIVRCLAVIVNYRRHG